MRNWSTHSKNSITVRGSIFAIALYQWVFSLETGIIGMLARGVGLVPHTSGCRFYPTCSQYAEETFLRHGFRKGVFLTVRRIVQCNPFVRGGYDPCPGVIPAKAGIQVSYRNQLSMAGSPPARGRQKGRNL